MSTEQVVFSRHDPGTSEREWWAAPQWQDVPALDTQEVVRRHPHVLVVAAHPDDEAIGIGGLLSDLAGLGARLTVLLATSGERSHELPDEDSRSALARARRRESERALLGLAPGAEIVHLGLPDTRVCDVEEVVAAAVAERAGPDTLVLAPWFEDGHTDHDAVGRAARAAGAAVGLAVAFYPIWLWHWSTPESMTWDRLVAVEVSLTGCWRKRAALEEFRSQTRAIGIPDGSEHRDTPVITAELQQRSTRLVETLLDPCGVLPVRTAEVDASRVAARTAGFDEMYDHSGDPWRFSGSFYEQRRRALVLAVLGRASYGRVLEIGCADGGLTRALVERSPAVTALDTSARAVDAAHAAAPTASVSRGEAPTAIPAGPFDLVLLSEVGYFLSPLELMATLRRAVASLAAGGEIVLCHWQHPTLGVPLDGALVHEQAAAVMGRPPRASYRDGDLAIDVWGEGETLAEQEGRA